jgi:YD repeat-containing protein
LNQSTNFDYNDRGQGTVTTLPWINGVRYTISNLYNPDGTLQRKTDQLGHITRYEYDDYRRLTKITPPVRGFGDSNEHSTCFFYDANGTGADYRYTDSNVTWVKLPSGKKAKVTYDDNRREQSMILAPGTGDEATTSYGYDNVGNVTSVTNPLNRGMSRLFTMSGTGLIQSPRGSQPATTLTYDTFGRQRLPPVQTDR